MTTYGFWDKRSEPKRNFRYKVSIEGFGKVAGDSAINLWMAKKVTKPSFTVGEVKANFIDKTFYYPGRVEWNTVEFTLFDPVNPNVVNRLAKMFANSGYFIPTNVTDDANYGSTAKSDAASNSFSLGEVKIMSINQEGHKLEEWHLNNAFIKSMKFGDLSYDSDDMLEVTMELRYDWAELWAYEIKYDSNTGLPIGETGKVFKTLGPSIGKSLNKDGTAKTGKIEYK